MSFQVWESRRYWQELHRLSGKSSSEEGFTRAPLSLTPQWRCGPVAKAVAPRFADDLPRCDRVSVFDQNLRQVKVHRVEAQAVIDDCSNGDSRQEEGCQSPAVC